MPKPVAPAKIAAPVLCLALCAGCGILGIGADAKLSEMFPGMSERMDKLECWLTIEFKDYPEGVDLQDVQVVFSSKVLKTEDRFDWAYIAQHDVVSRGFAKGFDPNELTSPSADPPLNVPIKVKYSLRARERIDLELTESLELQVELFWGGKKQGQLTRSVDHTYTRKFG